MTIIFSGKRDLKCNNLHYWDSAPKPCRIQNIIFLPCTTDIKDCLTHVRWQFHRLNIGLWRFRENDPWALISNWVRGQEEGQKLQRGLEDLGGNRRQPGRAQEGTSLTESLPAWCGLGAGTERWKDTICIHTPKYIWFVCMFVYVWVNVFVYYSLVFWKNKQKLPFMGGFCGHREALGEGEGRMSLPFISYFSEIYVL